MRKILLFLVCAVGLANFNLRAQTFTIADTVTASVTAGSASVTIGNYITNITGTNLVLRWRAVSSNFPVDWTDSAALAICDDELCRQNGGGQIWNPSLNSGGTYTATYSANATHDSTSDFHMLLNLSSATSTGQHYMTFSITDNSGSLGGYSKTTTFLINKIPESVANVNNQETNINLYPNPAHNEVNLVYNASADVKNIAVYNIIGKVMAVYKATENNSANLNIESLPSGIYFVRLMNSHGDVVVTRKFTKQ